MLPRNPPFSGYETAQNFRSVLKRRNETERGSKALSPDSRRSARPFRVDARPGTRQSDQAAYPHARPRGASGTGLCRMPRAAPAGAIPPSHVVVSAGTAGMAIVPGISPAAAEPPPAEGKRARHASSGNPRPDFTHRRRSGASAYRTHTEKTTHRPPDETATIPPSTGQTVSRGKGMSSVCRFGSMPCNAAFQPSLQQAGKFLLFRSPLASSALALLDHLKLPVRPHRRLSPSGGGPVA